MSLMQGVEFSHWIIDNYLDNNKVLVDATCGNGYDTLFLSKKLDQNGKIYTFDIQKTAIENTKEKLKDKDLKIEYINDGHEKIDKYIDEKINCIIYNLGYLPGSNKDIITKKETTIKSLQKSLKLLAINGLIVLVIYSEHEGGEKEKNAVLEFAANLDHKNYNVLHYHFINQKMNPSEVVVIKKRGDKDETRS
ncbi:MAG: class I SAM-dependent methyltransferase [Bacillota bacterium]